MVKFENDVWLIETNESECFILVSNKRLISKGNLEPFVKVFSKDEIKTAKIKGVKIPNYIKLRIEVAIVQMSSKRR